MKNARRENRPPPVTCARLEPGSGRVGIGSRLADDAGAQGAAESTSINPQGRSTPFGTRTPGNCLDGGRRINFEVGGL